MVNGLVYFGEPQYYVTRSLIFPLGPHLVNRSEKWGQTKCNSHERYKKDPCVPCPDKGFWDPFWSDVWGFCPKASACCPGHINWIWPVMKWWRHALAETKSLFKHKIAYECTSTWYPSLFYHHIWVHSFGQEAALLIDDLQKGLLPCTKWGWSHWALEAATWSCGQKPVGACYSRGTEVYQWWGKLSGLEKGQKFSKCHVQKKK